MAIENLDLTTDAFKANPYPIYARLRKESPVYQTKGFRNQQSWLLTRYDDVSDLLRDDERFAKKAANAMTPEQLKKAPKIPGIFAPLTNNLLFLDPPDHTRLRSLVHQAFTPRRVERMREETQALTHQLIDDMKQRGGALDFIKHFALPLPITIIGRILGVPEKDNDKFHKWTQDFVSVQGGLGDLLKMASIFRLMRYLRGMIKQRASDPQDDLTTALVQVQEEDDRLTEDEVLAMLFILLSAGHETTVNLIASGTLALLQHRDQWELLGGDPQLIRPAIEELLRFVTPAEMSTERYAKRDVDVAGVTIPRGALVLGVIASANRDEAYFDKPDVLDITRSKNKHLSFGQGIHYCVGAPLSRLEGTIAINTLIERIPDLQLAVPTEQLKWRSNFILRGLKELPVIV